MERESKKASENRKAKRVVDLYQRGNGLQAVAERLGKSVAWVRSVLVENGVPVRGRGRPRKV